jgi:GxxExxY protein
MYNDQNRSHAHSSNSRGPTRGPRDGNREDVDGNGRGEGRGERRGVPLSELDPALTDVSRRVIGCAIDVHKALGPGFCDGVYTNALCHELDQVGVRYKLGHPFPVVYKGKKVGEHPADIYVDDRFLVEIMAEHKEIGSMERATLRAQLRAADLELGLIINFAERRLKDGLVRVLNPEKIASLRGGELHDGHDAQDHADQPEDMHDALDADHAKPS